MATIPSDVSESLTAPQTSAVDSRGAKQPLPTRKKPPVWQRVLRPFASLRLTVTLFALSIGLIMIGTLAQAEKDMWDVIQDYFRCYIAWVELRILFPQSFFPNMPTLPGGFYFPGGATIGSLLALNLFAAHVTRFTLQARGMRLLLGSIVTLFGVLVTWWVIDSGHNTSGLQGLPLIEWGTLWMLIEVALAGAAAAAIVGWWKLDRKRTIERSVLAASAAVLGGLVVYVLVRGESAMLTTPSLRVLWQLMQASLAALILLAGCILLFKRRGGIVVIHLGVGLLMFSELWVSLTAVEEQIHMQEGQTVNFARDIREVELAFVDTSDPDYVEFVAIPAELLAGDEPITHDKLPFVITPVEYYRNASYPEPIKPDETSTATAGMGTQMKVESRRPFSGTDGGATDMAAAYVKIAPRDDPQSGEVYMFSQFFGDGEILQGLRSDQPEKLTAPDGRTYEASLRFRRNYKPYAITLDNVVREDYAYSNTPRDYSSYIRLVRDGDTVESRIWMNNPLRYAGETFYQSGYAQDRFGESTTLQVVTNLGWMIPYVACMIVAIGMLGHFGGSLARFLNRYYDRGQTAGLDLLAQPTSGERKVKRRKNTADTEVPRGGRWAPVAVAAVLVAIGLAWLASGLRSRDFNFAQFGEIPVVDSGRAKPISTLASTSLATVSNKASIRHKPGDASGGSDEEGPTIRVSAIEWFLQLAIQSEKVNEYRIFRVDNLDVQKLFELERRKGYRYSLNELLPQMERFETEAREAQMLSREDKSALSVKQRKLLELYTRLQEFYRLQASFRPIPFPAFPTAAEREQDREGTDERLRQLARMLQRTPELNASLLNMGPPTFSLAEPGQSDTMLVAKEQLQDPSADLDLVPYAVAINSAYPRRQLMGKDPDERLLTFAKILDAYDRGDAKSFNQRTEEYLEMLAGSAPKTIAESRSRVATEAFLNQLQPFSKMRWLYFVGFLMTCFAWLGARNFLNRTAFWLMLMVFVVHTAALIVRMYASGRPPVTNLYSSALVIAWGCVALGLVLEVLFRLSLGNIVAGVWGFLGLSIAYNLQLLGGDMMPVLQAVLDTQFWLTTHVVCVTFGYLATFVAGFLGIVYVLMRLLSPATLDVVGKELSRMIYGTVCFALFFSLFGTVLGGLWADDSWGRFWGWDPKENGALIIVLWNALILHARWGAMVKDRGLAVLAIVGNICTSWSWFGVNELGIGLHSYGFTTGVKLALGIFWTINFIIIALAWLPSLRRGENSATYVSG